MSTPPLGAAPENTPPGAADPAMPCEQALRQIERLVEENDLKEVERVLLSTHIKSCASCKAALERSRRLDSQLKDLFAATDTRPGFNRRLMTAIAAGGDEYASSLPPPAPSSETEFEAESGTPTRRLPTGNHRSTKMLLWAFRVPIAVCVLVGIGLAGAWYHGFGLNNKGDAPPLIMVISEGGTVTKDINGLQQAAAVGHALDPNEVLSAGNKMLNLTVGSGSEAGLSGIGKFVLSPNGELRALNRHSYKVLNGTVYFDVFKSRPRASSTEYFDVAAGDLATVRVTGTSFAVDMTAAEGATVVVEEGTVEVRYGDGTSVPVKAGQELTLLPGGKPADSDLATRLAWLNPPRPAVVPPPLVLAPKNPRSPPEETTPAVRPRFDWDKPVASLALAGKTAPEGVEAISELFGDPAPLQELLAQARRISAGNPLTFSVQHPMPVRSVLAWLARDTGVRFEINTAGAGSFRTVGVGQLPGPAAAGNLPDDALLALDAAVAGERLTGAANLPSFLRQLGEGCSLTILCDRELWERFDPLLNAPSEQPRSAKAILDELMGRMGANCAWYDDALYLSTASRIEALTSVERRTAPVTALAGTPLQAMWARDLRTVLEKTRYPPARPGALSDGALTGRPAFSNLKLDPGNADGLVLTYTSGLAGEQLMASTLEALKVASPAVSTAAGLLSQQNAQGSIADIDHLINQAQELIPIERRVKVSPYPHQALVNKSLSWGEALEWAAWLSGRGVRQEKNVLIVDELQACYGEPELQVLSLKLQAEIRRDLAPMLPTRIAQLLPTLYPVFFPDAKAVLCLQDRVVFIGDKRQLLLAQRLRQDLGVALESSRGGAFDLANWRPVWRQEIDRNLAEPFRGGGTGKLTGGFAWLLRQSALVSQLRTTVLVDPAFMGEHYNREIQNLDVSDATVGQVLERLARSVGLKMVIEGEVIWLRQ